jgi:hypothetical protein
MEHPDEKNFASQSLAQTERQLFDGITLAYENYLSRLKSNSDFSLFLTLT